MHCLIIQKIVVLAKTVIIIINLRIIQHIYLNYSLKLKFKLFFKVYQFNYYLCSITTYQKDDISHMFTISLQGVKFTTTVRFSNFEVLR